MLIFYITFLNKHLRSFQQKIFIYALGPLSSSSVWSDAVAICKCASTILTTIIVTWILLADTLKAKTQVMIGVLKKFLLWSNQSWPQFGCPVWLAQNISPSFCHQWPVKNFLVLFAAFLNWTEMIHINVFLLWCVDKAIDRSLSKQKHYNLPKFTKLLH